MNKIIITIDGPAASGKGSICKLISRDLNLFYLETGIYYRAFASLVKKKRVDIKEINNFILKLDAIILQQYLKNKDYLYSKNITSLSSKLAKLKPVRYFIVSIQQAYLDSYDKKFNGIILEGRDCGTVIAPKANLKIFLTANIEVRAKRRWKQLLKEKNNIKYEEIYKDLNMRDSRDKSRIHSPLIQAKDSILIDNTEYNFEQTINIVKNIIFSKIPTLKK